MNNSTPSEATETAVPVRLATTVQLGTESLIEATASLLCATGTRSLGKRDHMSKLKEHILQAGLNGMRAWRIGRSPAEVSAVLDDAFAVVFRHYRDELFPDEPRQPPYMARLAAWKKSLTPDQMLRYTSGRLKAFAETGRR